MGGTLSTGVRGGSAYACIMHNVCACMYAIRTHERLIVLHLRMCLRVNVRVN